MTYPIAEIFTSIQGEGVWTGTPMVFIRLAGCNVGHYIVDEAELSNDLPNGNDLPLLTGKKHSMCTAWDGSRFLCDTDYHKVADWRVQDLADHVRSEGVHHVCLTGGEPFIHDLDPILSALNWLRVHIETSGTKPLDFGQFGPKPWITCSPKGGFIKDRGGWENIDEWKFVITPSTDPETIVKFLAEQNPRRLPVYIQPLNGVHEVWDASLKRCLEILKIHPEWRLSAQLHKYLGVR